MHLPVQSAPLNIEVISGSAGSQATSQSRMPKGPINDEFLNNTTIVLNNKA